ncbi:hypothetical protein NDA18_000412 [Ustilago nuda]|nr:hypothetical protein NDA18_000412 [Ustilago nuda]
MKFSHSLQFNSVPDWADKYIAYSNLKKAIYIMEKELPSLPNAPYSDLENESSRLLSNAETSETDPTFLSLLDKELDKIVQFYLHKDAELRRDLQQLKDDVDSTENQDFDDDSDYGMSDEDEDDEHLIDTVRTGKASSNRRPSIEDLFNQPRKYNEAAREQQRMREGDAPSPTRKGSRATIHDGANPTRPANNRNRSSQLLDSSVADPSEAGDTSGSARRTRSSSNPSQSGKARWASILRKKPTRRRSLGLMLATTNNNNDNNPNQDPTSSQDRLAPASSDPGESSFGDDGKTMSIWTAENDYAIDMRITFKKRITDIFVAMSELKQFVSLNETGMRKILKKYDKITKSNLKDRYLNESLGTQEPFTAETKKNLEECIDRLIQLYAKVVTAGDVGAAGMQLKTHLREQVVWQRNTVWREMIGIERRAQGAALERTVMGAGKRDEYEAKKPVRFRTPCGSVALPAWLSMSTVHLIIAFTALVALLKAPGLSFFNRVEEQNCLAMLVFCTILWATEVIPLFVTSLMLPLLVVTLRVARTDDLKDRRMTAPETTKWIFSQMFAPNMCLLLGGFTLAAALSKYGIDKILATKILRLAGTRPSIVLLAHMGVACFASMWISNVAAPVLMYSLIQPILRTLPSKSPYASSLIMGIALASNIGGQTSPIASPQNLIALQYMKQPVGWLQWFAVTIPVSGLSLVVIWLILLWSYGAGKGTTIKKLGESRDSFTKIQWFISAVAISTICLWCLEKNFENLVGDMGIIAIIPMVLFFGTGILTKEDFNTFLWTVVFLAMGGIALGKAVTSSGLLESLDDLIQEMVKELALWQILIALLSIGLVVATFISHTIAAVLLVPIAAQVGESLQTPHPRLLIMATTLVASAAMGLPVSGYPNQIAVSMEDDLGDRYVTVKDFLRVGLPASVVATLIVGSVGVVIMYTLQF